MATIYLLEAVNLFIGDEDPNGSNHLELDELKLPEPAWKTSDHVGGGSVLDVGWGMNVLEKLEPTFKLKGMNPARLAQFSARRRSFTAYGVLREKKGSVAQEAKAVIEGMIQKVAPDSFKRGDSIGHDFMIQEVTSYSLFIAGSPIFRVDVFANIVEMGGVDQMSEVNRILRIPGSA